MTSRGRFSYSEDEMYCNDKGFMMTGESLKYLCAVLNSSLIAWLMKGSALTTGMGVPQWKKFAVERIPIPTLNADEMQPYVCKVDTIIQAKGHDPELDPAVTEREIDHMVYLMYGLTPDEISEVKKHV